MKGREAAQHINGDTVYGSVSGVLFSHPKNKEEAPSVAQRFDSQQALKHLVMQVIMF